MKRKLNERDIPEEVESSTNVEDAPQPTTSSPIAPISTFDQLGLDARLLQAIEKEQYATPTPVQAKAIPLAIEGKDILARSKTGSGKTAAYVLPILQTLLKRKTGGSPSINGPSALVLVPTRELAGQVSKAFEILASFCGQGTVRVENLTRKEDDKIQRTRLAAVPDVVVATPARACIHLNSGVLLLDDLAQLVVDEADLVLSYGHDEDVQRIAREILKGCQVFLMSATLSTEVNDLKEAFCRDPVLLEMDEEEKEGLKDGQGMKQYVVKCAEDEKFLLIYTIFKLKLIKGKVIVFVGDIDRCYRLKLFLEQFGVKSCVLNSELPVNSRIHVVEEFNKNIYDIIIATDENEVLGNEGPMSKNHKLKRVAAEEVGDVEEESKQEGDTKKSSNGVDGESTEPPTKKRKVPKRDKEYGISRGIDFKNVACVLNFDLPTSPKSYTHRIGRTARAGQSGLALSFVIPSTLYRKHKPTSFPICEHDEHVLGKIIKSQAKKGNKVEPYNFDMQQLDGFRYRLGDALRAVTKIAVREARVRELRQEILKSEKLKRHFEENPEEKRLLRHDGESRTARTLPHLKHVPEYLLPGGGTKPVDVGFVGFTKDEREGNRIRKARMQKRFKGKSGKKVGGRKADPLKTFNAKGKR